MGPSSATACRGIGTRSSFGSSRRSTPRRRPSAPCIWIVDNYGTHKHPRVKSWLWRHPRFHPHFIPTSSSWLNLVERWFRELTDKRIRRGSFHNVPQLIAAIQEYLDTHNQHPHVFTWTASVESILTKVAKCKEALDALH